MNLEFFKAVTRPLSKQVARFFLGNITNFFLLMIIMLCKNDLLLFQFVSVQVPKITQTFMSAKVQRLLKDVTGFNSEKVFKFRSARKLTSVDYKLVNDEQLKAVSNPNF